MFMFYGFSKRIDQLRAGAVFSLFLDNRWGATHLRRSDALLLGLLLAFGCGQRDPGSDPASALQASATQCQRHADCPSGEYCRFDQSYRTTSTGICDLPCVSSLADACPQEEQICHEAKCTSALTCETSSACPFGERCDQGVCTFPLNNCFFTSQCGNGFSCIDGACVENSDAECFSDGECLGVFGCADGSCVCSNEGRCVSSTAGVDCSISGVSVCSASQYCTGSVCVDASPCVDQISCNAAGLVCQNGFCRNPPVCGSSGECTTIGTQCDITINRCVPTVSLQCQVDDDCSPERYCDEDSDLCEIGCRQGVNTCPSGEYCTLFHECVDASQFYLPCQQPNDCPGGTACAPDDVSSLISLAFCSADSFLNGLFDCPRSCRPLCSNIPFFDTCGEGKQCGEFSSVIANEIKRLVGGLVSPELGQSVCYELED